MVKKNSALVSNNQENNSDISTLEKVERFADDIKVPALGGLFGWTGPLLLALLALILRLPGLGFPKALVFDETYYAKDALSLLNFGYERQMVEGADAKLLASDGQNYLGIFKPDASYIVHPPLGKWIIAIGENFFGATPFGWRISVCVLGILSVVLTARIARRITNSNLIGNVAGFLLAIDGLHIAMSRTALLDTTLSFFVLCAFGCLILDRDFVRDRMRDHLSVGIRWWRWSMALSLGLAIATKWSGVYFAVAFWILMLFWDFQVRREFNQPNHVKTWAIQDVLTALLLPVVVLTTYFVSWFGWFNSTGAWSRNWAETNGSGILPKAFQSLLHYHTEMLSFHTNLTSVHSYQANAWGWPVMIRPTSFFYGSEQTCGAATCAQEVMPLGNPLIWWGGALALVFMLTLAIRRANSAALPIVVAFAAGWVPWLFFPNRTVFNFYSVVFVPFTVIARAIALHYLNQTIVKRLPERSHNAEWQKIINNFWPLIVVLVAAALLAWYFYPIYVGHSLPYEEWRQKMWFKSWI